MLARSRAPVWRVGAGAPGGAAQQVRRLNLHEYQSKTVMEKFNVNVQRGKEATSAAAAVEIAR